jgi:hypothetical protein
VLPEEYKKEVTRRFKDFLKWIEDGNFNNHVKRQAIEIANGVTSYMNSESYYDSNWKEFVEYTQKLDYIRNELLADVEPKLERFINGKF